MVDGAVADALLLHAANHLLKGGQVLEGIAVHLNIADMPGIGQGVIGSLQFDFPESGDGEIHRDMKAVGVVFPVCDAGEDAEALLVDLDEAAGQTLGRGGQQGEVEPPLFGLLVHSGPHVGNDLQAQPLAALTLAVVLAGEGHQCLCKADEAHGQGAVLQNLPDLVVPAQLFAVQPHSLTHEEGEIADLLAALNFKPLQQLLHTDVHHMIQGVEKHVQIALGLDAQPGQIDGGKAQVAPLVADLTAGIVDIADDPGAAAHVGDFRLWALGIVILEVERRVHKAEIGEQPLGAAPDRQLEQVIVGLSGIVVDAVLHTENLDGEDRGFAVAQARLRGQENVFHDHAALGAGVHAVVDGGKGRLSAGAGMHGVQIVDESLHGLISGPVRLLHRPEMGEFLLLFRLLGADPEAFHELGPLRRHVRVPVLQGGLKAVFLHNLGNDGFYILFRILQPLFQHQGTGQVLPVYPDKGLPDAHGHAVIEVDDGLSAVLIVLVGLDGDAGQGGVGADIVGLPQGAVAGAEAALKQLDDVDLGAGGGQGVKIQIVNVNIALPVGFGMLRLQHEHLIELLGALTAVFQHGAHGGVAVDVGIFALDIAVDGVGIGDVLIDFHEAGIHFPGAVALVAVENIGFGGLDVAVVHQNPLHQVLDMLHLRLRDALHLQNGGDLIGQLLDHVGLAGLISRIKGLGNGSDNFGLIEFYNAAVSFLDFGDCHAVSSPLIW